MSQFTISSPLLSLIAPVVAAVVLSSCATSEVNREPISPPVDKKFALDGHLLKKPTLAGSESEAAGIPPIVAKRPVLPPQPKFQHSVQKYSVSAVNIPVSELLFKLAQDSGKQLDLHSGVDGTVTINAINQDLDKILERIAVQQGFLYEIDEDSISIRPDKPYWSNYPIDYVNIQKISQDLIDMKMSVGGASGLATTGTGAGTGGSSANIKVISEHNFWTKLAENLSRIVKSGLPQTAQTATAATATKIVNNSVVVNEEAGMISVFGTGAEHRAVKTYLADVMGRAEKQVLIEATVVEVELSDQYQAGIAGPPW
jgi:general secretion pathway protein D